ncbi:hypothetical protein [Clostridium omnivorum]|uniref:Uncharacterized protein n=1 Tax=Clostridium omnivorum TaxID=1604902 RepID=A0ABQ5NAD0_9CLOT|nr:hypothetical protein [Clostridium sp. E14]GLC32147.1 hypothetical protein bsdE14_35570 [Clostridium sp. E14]
MNKKGIQEHLANNGLTEIEEIEYKNDAYVLRFFYDFDKDEINAARAYANDESEDEENGDIWYEEFFLPYLSDVAVDNVGDMMEEIMEEFDIDAQFVSYEMDEEEYSYNEFIAAFFKKGEEKDIEQILEELEI